MKKQLLLTISGLMLITFLSARQKIIQLYDGPAPGSELWNWEEKENDKNLFQTKVVYNVTRPTPSVFLPEASVATGTAVVIAPGGGFQTLSINSEGFDVANWLVKKGVACFVLKYRLVQSLTDDPKWGMAALTLIKFLRQEKMPD